MKKRNTTTAENDKKLVIFFVMMKREDWTVRFGLFFAWCKRKTAPTSLDEKRRQLKRNVLITMVKFLMQI